MELLKSALQYYPKNTRVRVAVADLLEMQGAVAEARDVFWRGQEYAEAFGDAGFFQVSFN
jgi:hypothetical protein